MSKKTEKSSKLTQMEMLFRQEQSTWQGEFNSAVEFEWICAL